MITTVEFHTFFCDALPKDPVVLDLGANKGAFSRKMHKRFGIDCIAVEADPALCASLRKMGLRAHHVAIADHIGTVAFHQSKNDLAGSFMATNGGTTIEVPCVDLMSFVERQNLHHIDLLKMDIEGAELEVFAACSDSFLKSIPQITVEFHDFCGISTSEEVEDCLHRFDRLGFDQIRMSRVGHQDTLLVNRALVPLSALQFGWAKYGFRNIKGAERIARKMLYRDRWAENYD